jgi:hypothetical protein
MNWITEAQTRHDVIDVQLHPDGPQARAALRARVRALQADDPVRPVTVAVPSNYAGLALRRALIVDGKETEKHHRFLGENLLARDYASSRLDSEGAWQTARRLGSSGKRT